MSSSNGDDLFSGKQSTVRRKRMQILFIIYCIIGYWASGVVVFQNKIVIHSLGGLFMAKLLLGICFGFILIPVAIIMKLLRLR